MANSLLDFVMSLVRDPDAAAQYAADPAQAIADANLTDVTSADVSRLIPVVAESMSTVVPSGAIDGGGGTLLDSAHNVWASGAATAAFDAFDDHLPLQGGDWATGELADQVPLLTNVIAPPEEAAPTIADQGVGDLDVPTIATVSDVSNYHDGDVPLEDHVPVHDAMDDQVSHSQDPDFDIFT